jgi:hypothetical protein
LSPRRMSIICYLAGKPRFNNTRSFPATLIRDRRQSSHPSPPTSTSRWGRVTWSSLSSCQPQLLSSRLHPAILPRVRARLRSLSTEDSSAPVYTSPRSRCLARGGKKESGGGGGGGGGGGAHGRLDIDGGGGDDVATYPRRIAPRSDDDAPADFRSPPLLPAPTRETGVTQREKETEREYVRLRACVRASVRA